MVRATLLLRRVSYGMEVIYCRKSMSMFQLNEIRVSDCIVYYYFIVAMGLSKEWGIETSEQHYQKSSYPMQSGIVWGWKDDRKIKVYYHNIGEVGLTKDASYTG